jgi:hypothetical protein
VLPTALGKLCCEIGGIVSDAEQQPRPPVSLYFWRMPWLDSTTTNKVDGSPEWHQINNDRADESDHAEAKGAKTEMRWLCSMLLSRTSTLLQLLTFSAHFKVT